jgi:hypothetical protein
MQKDDDDFTIRHSTMAEMMRQVRMPDETVLEVKNGSIGYSGRAMAIDLAGQDVILVASNIAKLDAAFNYIQAALHGAKAACAETLRTDRCPEVVVMAQKDTTLDEL